MTTPTPTDWPPLIAGQPALDLLNTLTLEGGASVEHLSDDAAAAAWLSRATELDFALVRQCEHSDCVLWFHDTTKSHRRRWCAMALCGNRHKVSEFRKRRGG